MSTIEANSGVPEEDEKDSSAVSTDITTPVNFIEATAAHFGISVQSFIPASLPSSNRKEKSRLALLKARRRSNIGVRGSPETNSLIRFMAQQKMKTPPAPHTPEYTRSSPFQPRVAFTLRQKMTSFQSLMGMEENEDCDVMLKQDSSTGGCITTRVYLSDGENLEAGKENHPPSMILPPNKKRRMGPSQGCEGKIREDSNPTLHFNLKELEEEEASVKHKLVHSNETKALVIASPFNEGELPISLDAQFWSPTEGQQEVVFELQSTPDDPTASSSAQPACHFQIPSISSLEMKTSVDPISSPTVKKKQVRFGEPLPPEVFDKTLPPSTPLQKGGTPARAPTPGRALKLRSLLKTPQRVESPTTQPRKEFHSPSIFGTSPTLSMPRSRRMVSTGEDGDDKDGKILFFSEEIENEVDNDEDCILNTQPLNLDEAFNEESLYQTETECETKVPETSSPLDLLTPEPLKEKNQSQTESGAAASGRSCKRRGKVTHDLTAQDHSTSQKRKLPEDSEPGKRSIRTAAKMASGKMKTTTAARRWNKKVDHSLYGSRQYASKTPILSPITERLSFGLSFTAEESLSDMDPSQESPLHPSCNGKSVSGDSTNEAAKQISEMGDTATLNAFTTPEVSVSFPMDGKEGVGRRSRRLSGSKVRGKALKGGRVSGNGHQSDEMVRDQTKDNPTVNCENETNPEKLVKGLSNETKVDNYKLCPANYSDTQSTESEVLVIMDSPAPIISVGKALKQTLKISEDWKESNPVEDKIDNEVEKGQGDQTVKQQDYSQSSSDSQDTAAAQLSLPPWQADFNLEDVFKPVASRGQCLVRRSLRNKSSADDSGGLAWLPHTSPESIKESRRRTRGRRHSAALAALASEVTQP